MGANSTKMADPTSTTETRVPNYSYDPDKAWSILQLKRKVEAVDPLPYDAPKPEAHTRFVCISGVWGDIHTMKKLNLLITRRLTLSTSGQGLLYITSMILIVSYTAS